MRVFGRPVTKGVDDARGVTLVYRKLVRRMELEGETNFKFVLHRQTTMTMLDGVVHERHPSVTVVCMSAFEPNSLRDLLREMVGVDTHPSSLSNASPVTPRPQTFSQSTFSPSNDDAISHPRKEHSYSPLFRIKCRLPNYPWSARYIIPEARSDPVDEWQQARDGRAGVRGYRETFGVAACGEGERDDESGERGS